MSSIAQIPVFIPVRDRVTPLKQVVNWLEKAGHEEIWLIDNNSSYPPLLEYLAESPHHVVRTGFNLGHRAPWLWGTVQRVASHRHYIVTDPDVLPTEDCPEDAALYLLDALDRFVDVVKVGLGLKIDDLPAHYPLRDAVVDWEKQFWKTERAPGLYEADVDTTFAIYRPYSGLQSHHPCLRTGAPYLARHLPWYSNPSALNDEDHHYRQNASMAVSNWDRSQLAAWKHRLSQLDH